MCRKRGTSVVSMMISSQHQYESYTMKACLKLEVQNWIKLVHSQQRRYSVDRCWKDCHILLSSPLRYSPQNGCTWAGGSLFHGYTLSGFICAVDMLRPCE